MTALTFFFKEIRPFSWAEKSGRNNEVTVYITEVAVRRGSTEVYWNYCLKAWNVPYYFRLKITFYLLNSGNCVLIISIPGRNLLVLLKVGRHPVGISAFDIFLLIITAVLSLLSLTQENHMRRILKSTLHVLFELRRWKS